MRCSSSEKEHRPRRPGRPQLIKHFWNKTEHLLSHSGPTEAAPVGAVEIMLDLIAESVPQVPRLFITRLNLIQSKNRTLLTAGLVDFQLQPLVRKQQQHFVYVPLSP